MSDDYICYFTKSERVLLRTTFAHLLPFKPTVKEHLPLRNPPHLPSSAAGTCLHLPNFYRLPRVQWPSVSLAFSRLTNVGRAFPEKTRMHGFFVSMYGGGRIEMDFDDECHT
ncbi:uncharacterized protein LACBIDRAFT_307025 [Laccaria bicolor S238N-H82]|uniref:Predicted protein n=1 Tax=Laccaria bicolor (strain S238N-H82 / ATCC MYA-4686) TaxID=486041 RepID=B0DP72_LACBS|nr:uncharacterized protein LACBIDRAFT_307025 [Laccaria bicolor S238N-H82]EDR03635.1 predicted protein [Laccaria bicolor S238N-H82]|eukprot:XP_001885783.1 predicted protein [Laccaria bicolor S238N-H82]